MTAKVQIFDNGPILVKGDVDLLDGQGNSYQKKDEYYLCRCNLTDNKPFCDGKHQGGFSHCAKADSVL